MDKPVKLSNGNIFEEEGLLAINQAFQEIKFYYENGSRASLFFQTEAKKEQAVKEIINHFKKKCSKEETQEEKLKAISNMNKQELINIALDYGRMYGMTTIMDMNPTLALLRIDNKGSTFDEIRQKIDTYKILYEIKQRLERNFHYYL